MRSASQGFERNVVKESPSHFSRAKSLETKSSSPFAGPGSHPGSGATSSPRDLLSPSYFSSGRQNTGSTHPSSSSSSTYQLAVPPPLHYSSSSGPSHAPGDYSIIADSSLPPRSFVDLTSLIDEVSSSFGTGAEQEISPSLEEDQEHAENDLRTLGLAPPPTPTSRHTVTPSPTPRRYEPTLSTSHDHAVGPSSATPRPLPATPQISSTSRARSGLAAERGAQPKAFTVGQINGYVVADFEQLRATSELTFEIVGRGRREEDGNELWECEVDPLTCSHTTNAETKLRA